MKSQSCKLPCFEHHSEVNFFHILVSTLMRVSLKENSEALNLLNGIDWCVHKRLLSGEMTHLECSFDITCMVFHMLGVIK